MTKRVAAKAKTIVGFRKPWVGGARAYAEADTFAAALEGFKRFRTDQMFHMPNTGEAGKQPCVVCGKRLADPAVDSTKIDRQSTWTYSAARKQVGNGTHYICSWTALLTEIFRQADAGILR